MISFGTLFGINLCTVWSRRLDTTSSGAYIKKVTIAMRDVDCGRPNITLMLFVRGSRFIAFGICQFVCSSGYNLRTSRLADSYKLVTVNL